MALVLLQPGGNPLGQLDCVDAQLTSFKGGEICTWGSVTYQGTDEASADVNNDGYLINGSNKLRPAITQVWGGSGGTPDGYNTAPYFLADDGVLNYGTLFGQIVGATVGQQSVNGVVLGPHTATGSGKITCWDKPGLYGVTLDAVDTTASTGLVPTNTTLVVGNSLGFTTGGLLTPKGSAQDVSPSGVSMGHLAEFSPRGSLVTTPNTLVAALNSPSGDVTSVQQAQMYMAVFSFNGAGGGF